MSGFDFIVKHGADDKCTNQCHVDTNRIVRRRVHVSFYFIKIPMLYAVPKL